MAIGLEDSLCSVLANCYEGLPSSVEWCLTAAFMYASPARAILLNQASRFHISMQYLHFVHMHA